MKKNLIYILFLSVLIIFYVWFTNSDEKIDHFTQVDRLPEIFPAYHNTTIPPNIAPLNFLVRDTASYYRVNIRLTDKNYIRIEGNSNKIKIPPSRWRQLLRKSEGRELQIELFLRQGDQSWLRYKPITMRIAREDIDRYLVYRLLKHQYMALGTMGIYQRDLQNFNETAVLENSVTKSCINCHTFHKNASEKFIIHMRYGPGAAMLLYNNSEIVKIDTRTEFNVSPAAYSSWHPNGNLLAFSVNKVKQFFHAAGGSRDVIDLSSDLILYTIDSNTITVSDLIANPRRMETFPAWSADGRHLYFVSAPQVDPKTAVFDFYRDIRYSLMRASYNPDKNNLNSPETVLGAEEIGGSITEPNPSPDGNYLLFTRSEYGNFPVCYQSSDLYMYDLKRHTYSKPEINSAQSECCPSWSSNSRWIVFASKRIDALYARLYISYVDSTGYVHPPFLLPQEDPAFYVTFLKTYNVPELIDAPVSVSQRALIAAAFDTSATKKAQLTMTRK
jgi:Tol biopolymer transport system component